MRALVNLIYRDQKYHEGDSVPIEPHEGALFTALGLTWPDGVMPRKPLAVYMGKDTQKMVPGALPMMFDRGVPRAVNDQNSLDIFKSLYPEFQIVNEKGIYIGSSVTVRDFADIEQHLPENPRVLVMRDMGLGDIIMIMPTLAELRRRLPGARITFATLPPYMCLFDGLDIMDEVVPMGDLDLQESSYDLVINAVRAVEMYHVDRNRGPRVDSFAAIAGLRLTERVVKPVLSEDAREAARALLPDVSGPYIGYVLQAAEWARSYPAWRARDVMQSVHEKFPEHKIVVFDGGSWGMFDGMDYVIDLGGKTRDIMDLGAAMERCEAVVAPDTGAAHLSATLGVKTLVLLSSQPFEWRYNHYGNHVRSIHKIGAAPCVPCWTWQRDRQKLKFCMKSKDNVCMKSIRPDEIADGLDRLLRVREYAETVSAVVLCHNRFETTRRCVDALRAGHSKPYEIILVDNASTDETRGFFSHDPRVIYIRREVNDGSIIGRNVGMRAAQGDRIWTLDNDQIVGPETLEKYLECDSDLVGAALGECNQRGVGRQLSEYAYGDTVYLGIGGLMIKRAVVDRIGYLDEGFAPAYCDDPDFYWRAIEAGFTWSWMADNGITHEAHSTLGDEKTIENDAAYRKSHARLIEKWPRRFPFAQPLRVSAPPLVSYVIPTYNREKFLPECIDSILSQTYKNIEIIVVDDGSTDGTESLIKEKYPKIKYLKNDRNRRIPYTLNRGFRAARGEYVCWLSSDDGIFPEKTERQVQLMSARPDIDLCFTEYEIHWHGDAPFTGRAGDIQKWTPKRFPSNHDEFLHCLQTETCNANGSTAMFRKSSFRRMGYLIETLWTCQDWEMWLRYFREGHVSMINECLGWRNEHRGISQGICQGDPEALKLFNTEKKFIKDYYRLFIDKNRPTVCAMLCVKNEEQLIEQCLDDLILWVDKIVILDDGSTDRTPEIIRQYPKVVDIHTQPNKGNVRTEGRDRQKLLEMAQATGCDWLLFIDTDEVFEDRMKSDLYDMITDEKINLYHFHEINLWRSDNCARIDESYDLGWFGRLFRNTPGLLMNSGTDEHCCGIPNNIPGCSPWYRGEPAAVKSGVGVKHYGFADYQRTVERAYRRWIRDPYRMDPGGYMRGGWFYYERMINETGLQLVEYRESLV